MQRQGLLYGADTELLGRVEFKRNITDDIFSSVANASLVETLPVTSCFKPLTTWNAPRGDDTSAVSASSPHLAATPTNRVDDLSG
jgi:hypothetical protein